MVNGRCYFHGGATPGGIASVHFKTGRHSKYFDVLPADLAPHFHADHARAVDLLEELALTESSIAASLEQLQAGDATAPQWEEARAAIDAFKRAREAKDLAAMAAQFERLDELLTVGASREHTANTLFERVKLCAKLVAVESKPRKDEREMVERAEFGRFAKAVLLAVVTRVVDMDIRAAIQADVLRMVGIALGSIDDKEPE